MAVRETHPVGIRVALQIPYDGANALTRWILRAMRHGWQFSSLSDYGLYLVRRGGKGDHWPLIKVGFDGGVAVCGATGRWSDDAELIPVLGR